MSISLSISVSIISISTSIIPLHLHPFFPFFPRMDIISLWLTAIYYFSLIINLNLKRKKPWHQTSLPWIKISLRGCHFLISAMKQIYAGMALLWLVRCRECSGDNSTAQGSLPRNFKKFLGKITFRVGILSRTGISQLDFPSPHQLESMAL